LAQDLLHDVIKEARSLGWVQWLVFLTGLVYIYFATRSDARCWIWGILSSALWAYTSWFQLNLLSDSILQMIYVVLGVWGLYSWRIKKNKTTLPVSHCSPSQLILYLFVGAIFSIALGQFMKSTQAAFPMLDAALTVFSVIATIMLIKQQIENWIFWIVINLVSIPVFIIRDGHLFALLFLIYFVLSIKGWKEWQQLLRVNAS